MATTGLTNNGNEYFYNGQRLVGVTNPEDAKLRSAELSGNAPISGRAYKLTDSGIVTENLKPVNTKTGAAGYGALDSLSNATVREDGIDKSKYLATPKIAQRTQPTTPGGAASGVPGGGYLQGGGYLIPAGAENISQVQKAADANSSNAYVRGINAPTETVAGQLSYLQRSDSDLMKLADLKGREQAAKSGLLSSSLASGAAQRSVLEAATPIAQQDAAAYLKQAQSNQDTINQFRGRTQQGGIDTAARTQQAGIDTEARTQQAGIDTAARTQQAGIDTGARTQEAGIDTAARFQQADLDAKSRVQEFELSGKSEAQKAQLQEQLNRVQSGLDIQKLRADYAAQGQTQQALTKAEYDLKSQQLAQEFGYTMEEAGGKQNAALAAQYIQAVAEINKSDMDLEDKRKQIEDLKSTMLSVQAATSMEFNNPEMQSFYIDQMTSVEDAAAEADNGVSTEAVGPTDWKSKWQRIQAENG